MPADYRPALVIISKEGLSRAQLSRSMQAIADGMSAACPSGHRVSVQHVPPSLAPGLAPKLMAPSADSWRPHTSSSSRPFYASEELPECALIAVSAGESLTASPLCYSFRRCCVLCCATQLPVAPLTH
jgi:hypothetical protein